MEFHAKDEFKYLQSGAAERKGGARGLKPPLSPPRRA